MRYKECKKNMDQIFDLWKDKKPVKPKILIHQENVLQERR